MDKQREMFEAWYSKHCEPGVGPWFVRDEDNSDEYYMSHTQTAWDAWQAAIAAQWQPIETLPVKQLMAAREMFIVRGFGVEGVSIMPYTTDAYAVWLESDCGCHYKFARWKHNFQPTHWMPLPPEPTK